VVYRVSVTGLVKVEGLGLCDYAIYKSTIDIDIGIDIGGTSYVSVHEYIVHEYFV